MTELCETRYPQFSGNADCFQVLLECDFLSQDSLSVILGTHFSKLDVPFCEVGILSRSY